MNHRHRPPNEWSSHRLNWAVGQSMPGSVGLWFEERRLQCYETCEEACAVTDVWHSCKRRTIKGGTEQSESTRDNGGRCLLPHLGVWSSKECSQVSVSQDNMRVCSHTHMHWSLFVWMHFISWPCFNQCWYLKVQYRTVCRTLDSVLEPTTAGLRTLFWHDDELPTSLTLHPHLIFTQTCSPLLSILGLTYDLSR